MTGILIAGTSSDAGKSLVVTGLCRALRRRGIDVAPFKAQNMSNNSMVCADGSEIGRAQYLQAQAAGVEPSSLLNPVLLKPGTDRRSFVVLRGRPGGTLEAGEYATGRRHLAEAAFDAYRELAARHELVVVEGAGSPAEINLRTGDYVNLGLARKFGLPVVIVGDIDRGGVLASIFGTWGLIDDADRSLLAGYVINKFRGDQALLTPGLAELSARTGLENLGVLPWLGGVWLDGEDALQVDRWRAELPASTGPVLRVAVVRFPRISNATDVEALAHTPGVDVLVTDDPARVRDADLLVLPGSRSTVSDLAWLRSRGLDQVVAERHAAGLPVLGICGGYQMLADTIADEVESGAGHVSGLGVLPVKVRFETAKTTTQTTLQWRGHQVFGYEIHHGYCRPVATAEPFLDGWQRDASFGTMLHGSLENDDFRAAFLTEVAELAGSPWRPDPAATGYGAAREQMIETLADAVAQHVDLDRLLELAHINPGPTVNADAPATRPTRQRPLLIVHTGDGKGKTTAALGMGLRGWAQGWSIGVYQFIKAPTWPTGERLAYQALASTHARTGQGGPIEWRSLGAGRTTTRAAAARDHAGLARAGWLRIAEQLAAETHDLYILDELCHALHKGWLDVEEVVEVLANRPGHQHVVITGRNAPAELLAIADLACDVRKLKHPFDQGVKGQPGIEW